MFELLHVLILLIVVMAVAIGIVRYFASPRVSISVQILTAFSFMLAMFGTLLISIDLSVMSKDSVQDNPTRVPWKVLYWVTFVFAWYVLPLTRESVFSGRFSFFTKLGHGCKTILCVQMVMISIALSLVAAIAAVEHSMYVGGVLASLTNTYGLLYVSLLMGYGLVEFPRSLWREAFPESQLRRSLIKSIAADEALFEVVWEVQDIENVADAVLTKIAREGSEDPYYNQCVERVKKRKDELLASMSPDLRRRRHNNDRVTDSTDEYGIKTPGKLPTLKHLARLNKRLLRVQDKLYGAMLRWEGLVKRIAFLTAITDAGTVIGDDTHAPLIQSTQTQASSTWMKYLRSPFYKSVALLASILSMLILWSEASLSAKRNLSPISLLLNDVQESNLFIFRIIVQIPLLYMSLCAYTSLFKLVSFVPANPHLGGHKQSDGPGLLFNTQILVRLQFPLCYNYLLTLKYDPATTTCAFLKQMGIMHPIPFFGSSFTIYGPLLMVTLCCFSLFNGYPRLLALIGVEHEDRILSGDKMSLEVKLNEGIALIKRYADKVEHAVDDTSSDKKKTIPTVRKSKFEYHGSIGKKPSTKDDDDNDDEFNSFRGKKSSKFEAV